MNFGENRGTNREDWSLKLDDVFYMLLGLHIEHPQIFLHLDLFMKERVIYLLKFNIRLFRLLRNAILMMIYPYKKELFN